MNVQPSLLTGVAALLIACTTGVTVWLGVLNYRRSATIQVQTDGRATEQAVLLAKALDMVVAQKAVNFDLVEELRSTAAKAAQDLAVMAAASATLATSHKEALAANVVAMSRLQLTIDALSAASATKGKDAP